MLSGLNREVSLQDLAALQIGKVLLAASSLELEIDELLFLANERVQLSDTVKSFPVTLTCKFEALKEVSSRANCSALFDEIVLLIEDIVSIRNSLAHSRVVSIEAVKSDYLLRLYKKARPNRVDGKQIIGRDFRNLKGSEITSCLHDIETAFETIEKIRVAVWRSGDGWPNYLTGPRGDIFGFSVQARPKRYVPDEDD